MYRFLDRLDAGRRSRRSPRSPTSRCWRAASPASANSIICITIRAGAPTRTRARPAKRIAAAADDNGIALTLLPVFYAHANFGGAPPAPGQRRFLNSVAQFAKLMEASRAAIAPLAGANIGVAPHSLARRHAGGTGANRAAGEGRPDPHPCRRADQGSGGLRRVVGRASGGMAARPRRPRAPLVPGACDPHDAPQRRRGSRRAAPSQDCVQSPKPISATVFFRRRIIWRKAGASASAPIPTYRSTRPRSCASLEYAQRLHGAAAMCSPPKPGAPPAEPCSMRRSQAARRRWGRRVPASRRVPPPTSSASMQRHPSFAGPRG